MSSAKDIPSPRASCLRRACAVLAVALLLWHGIAPATADDTLRVALVIGNADYLTLPNVANAARDADKVADALAQAGFAVTRKHDLGNRALRAALQEFARDAAGVDVAVIYFAGHGLAVDGVNWLLPVDAQLTDARDVDDQAVKAERLAAALDGARSLQLVILDACRRNPFARKLGSGGGQAVLEYGLWRPAEAALRPKALIAFAAREGHVGQDGPDGGNGPYATALAAHLGEAGADVRDVLARVSNDVQRNTANVQEPMVYGGPAEQKLFLVAPPPDAAPGPGREPAPKQAVARPADRHPPLPAAPVMSAASQPANARPRAESQRPPQPAPGAVQGGCSAILPAISFDADNRPPNVPPSVWRHCGGR